jgi:methionyl-tRNA synthetase
MKATGMDRAFFVTTPIYYISGNPHIGHAYTTIAADVVVRTARGMGAAYSLTGTDEHGQKVANAAAAAGKTPQAYVDALAPRWQSLGPTFNARFDDFIRTTDPRHIAACQAVFERLRATGDIYLGTYEGWYCTNDETFWPEAKLIEGRCPNPECRRAVDWLSEEDWFFRLSAYRDRLIAYFKAQPDFVRPQSVWNEMMATLEGGLDDLSISRSSFDWGVPLPGGVMYVWFDALLNYISATGWHDDPQRFAQLWPPSVQLVGKEIARFHTIIWPAMLWALELEPPKRVFAHGWILSDGQKMSKSLGNVFDPFELVDVYGADSIRYFLLREAPFGSDFTVSTEKLRTRHNSDLGNDLGNLLRRSLAMLLQYRNGLVPPATESAIGERFADLGDRVYEHVTNLQFRDALEAIWELVTALNREIDERKPWVLHKQGRGDEVDAVLYDLCEGLRWLAILIHPFMPDKGTAIWRQLGLSGTPEVPWRDELRWGGLAANTQTDGGEKIFPRIDGPTTAA